METIQNNQLKISVQKKGAELCSIVSLNSGKEYMWDANPAVWSSYAPVLFPIVGALKEEKYVFKGKHYSVPKHGFIRNNEQLNFKRIADSCLEFSLKFDEESLKSYPFQFEFFIRFILQENSILIVHEIVNHSQEDTMYFSLGGHPAFKCPLNEHESYEDYYLEFERPETVDTWEVLPTGLIAPSTRPLLNNSAVLELNKQLFDRDALILKEHTSKKVSLKNRKGTNCITVEYSDFSYLGIWSKQGADFVCIEPWLGISDSHDTDQDFTTKEGILKLEANSSFKASYRIKVEE